MSTMARRVIEVSRAARRQGSPVARLVALCVSHPLLVLASTIVLCAITTHYVVHHFAMTTDTDALLSHSIPWRRRQNAFDAAFPQNDSNLVVVVDGRTPELSEVAAARLAAALRADRGLFQSVARPDAGPFWTHEGLLFDSSSKIRSVIAQLVEMQPFLGSMAQDPSLRGLADTLSLTLQGVNADHGAPDLLRNPIRELTGALENLRHGGPVSFSWRNMITGQPADRRELRHIILVDPRVNYAQLEPGRLPVEAIRATAMRLRLNAAHGVSVRITGQVALADDEFATLTQGAGLIASIAACAIVLMLWFAVRSPWLIASIVVTMFTGLLVATAIGLAFFHRFNVISVAFIPLFVGMGMDLGIQFSVRYRAERASGLNIRSALIETGHTMGKSLTLAATAIGLGFLAFAPTPYYGVSQLGVIAGVGMFAALILNLTLLPALIALTRAPGACVQRPRQWLASIDHYVPTHRKLVVALGAAAALVCAALLPWLRFDFNPMHLRNPRAESVATLVDLMKDPEQSPNTVEVIRPSLAAADRLARAFRRSPLVYGARTLSSFIPDHQKMKLALIGDAANLLNLTLSPIAVMPAPTDSQVVRSLIRAAENLRNLRTKDVLLREDANALAHELDRLARSAPSARVAAARMLIPGFLTTLHQLRDLLHPGPIDIHTLPPQLRRQWETPDGRARVSVLPKGDSNDDTVLRRFVAATVKIAPDATGTAIYIQAYARAVVDAFIEAGALSFVIICCLLLLALRRIRDVAVTMAPIVLTGLLTMGTCLVIRQPLNYANIIALPLLFGIGVAFHIYFVMSWRGGGANLLTSSLARGVFFSALATATGFGSLWASSDPGTASMGKLLMISLVWTLISALLFQPALIAMGCTRTRQTASGS
jgi:uncharacterized protein